MFEDLLKKMNEQEYDIASPEEMGVVEVLEPLIDKYGPKEVLKAIGAFVDTTEDFDRFVDSLPLHTTHPGDEVRDV